LILTEFIAVALKKAVSRVSEGEEHCNIFRKMFSEGLKGTAHRNISVKV
jgi:hypothetical protein